MSGQPADFVNFKFCPEFECIIELDPSSFSESTDWEAKFYQIQSKYLLLLNELHNPQVSESDSRKEMVGQLLKDVVEAADRPQLNSNNAQFDR